MVARVQQLIVLGWVVLATAWTVWSWPRSPALALAGNLALALAHSAVLAIEFIASHRVSAADPLPRATAAECVRAWWAETGAAVRVFCWQQPFRSRSVADHVADGTGLNGRRGAVLVHGFMCNRGFWNPWLRTLQREDRAFVAVNLEPVLGPIDAYVRTIDEAIARVADATGQPPLLICHSMGGLAARAWLRAHGGHRRVHRIVTMGTPHGGTWIARFFRGAANGRQMRLGAEWLIRMSSESTGTREVPFTCWYSNCDNVVFPISTATLLGADNRLVSGRGHVEIALDPRVQRETLALLDAP